MQDFRNLTSQDISNQGITRLPRDISAEPIPKEYGSIYDKSKVAKESFIEARLNKDNLWNLIFAGAMVNGWSLTFLLVEFSLVAAFLCSWMTILLVPIALRIFNKTTLTEDKKFLNNKDEDITDKLPNTLVWPIIFTFGLTALIGNIFDNHGKNLPEIISLFAILSSFFFSFSLYFILINCPISVLFSRAIWKEKRTDIDFNNSYQYKPSSSSTLFNLMDPGKSYLPYNRYHNK